jgi:hypothetical protein
MRRSIAHGIDQPLPIVLLGECAQNRENFRMVVHKNLRDDQKVLHDHHDRRLAHYLGVTFFAVRRVRRTGKRSFASGLLRPLQRAKSRHHALA